MTETTDEEALARLAAEVAELLRFEHDAGAIGVVEGAPRVLAPRPVPDAPRPARPEAPRAARPEASTTPAFARPAAVVAPAPLAPSMGEVDALLAAARRARAPAPRADDGPAPSESRATVPEPRPRQAPATAPALAAPPSRAADGRLTVLSDLARDAAVCTACRLHETRTKSVFSRGSADAEVVFVGEGPGFNEDKQGEPFVGAAGQLLDKMIAAMGLARDGVYVCNVVKCRPPENRTPLPDEAAACSRFLDGQLGAIKPRVLVALGRCAAERLGCVEPGRTWRGTWGEYQGVPVMPTYHPAYLLRNAEMKRPVWEDLQKVVARIGRAQPAAAGPAVPGPESGEAT